MADQKEVITLGGRRELDPEGEAKQEQYRRDIAKARGDLGSVKGREPVGVVERPQMPDFSALHAERAAQHQITGMSDSGGVQPRPAGSPAVRPETAAEIAAAMGAAEKIKQKEEEEKATAAKEEKETFLDFDFGNFQTEAERVLSNKKRREDIESRCVPMELEDLIMRDEVQQVIPIIPGKYEVVFRSLTPEENLFLKRLMADEEVKTDAYIQEKFGLCQITCAIVSINKVPFPDHRDSHGSPDAKLFDAKLKKVLRKSGYILADLSVNYAWFDIRVRRLLNPNSLGNG